VTELKNTICTTHGTELNEKEPCPLCQAAEMEQGRQEAKVIADSGGVLASLPESGTVELTRDQVVTLRDELNAWLARSEKLTLRVDEGKVTVKRAGRPRK
jgi:hypothetical protein